MPQSNILKLYIDELDSFISFLVNKIKVKAKAKYNAAIMEDAMAGLSRAYRSR